MTTKVRYTVWYYPSNADRGNKHLLLAKNFDASSKEDAVDRFKKSQTSNRRENYVIDKVTMEWENPKDRVVYTLQDDETAEVSYVNLNLGDQSLKEVIIPDTIKLNGHEYKVSSIGKDAFRYLRGLKKIHFPKWLNTIRSHAFSESGVEEIIINSWLTNIEEFAFDSCNELKRLHIKTTLGLEKLSKCAGKEETIITTTHNGPHFFDILDMLGIDDHWSYLEELSNGVQPNITLFLNGSLDSLSFSTDSCGISVFEDLNIMPKVSIILNKSNCKINLDYHEAEVNDLKNLTMTVKFTSINAQSDEIDVSGVDDFSDFDID